MRSLSYGFSNTDTLTSIADGVTPAMSATFGYDASDRVASVTRDAQSYSWDLAGNRTGQQRLGVNYSFTPDSASNQLRSWSSGSSYRNFSYDAVGNLSSEARNDGTRGYEYGLFNRLGEGLCQWRIDRRLVAGIILLGAMRSCTADENGGRRSS